MWDERYASEHFVYGQEPNAFLKQYIDNHKPGPAKEKGAMPFTVP